MNLTAGQISTLSILIVSLLGCKDTSKQAYTLATNSEAVPLETVITHPGKKLMETKCYVCHNPTTDFNGRIAPPMVAVKSHYLNEGTTKEAFTNAIWHFVEKPNEENVKMKGAVRRFGIMPYQPFVEEDIRLIAEYMFDFKIDEPEWFKQHIEEESKGRMKYRNDGKSSTGAVSPEKKTPVEIGMKYALNTKTELGKNLMGSIQKKGTLEAVSFCNKQAYPITERMALAQNATIRRVSDKPRNPANAANAKENEYIQNYKAIIASGKKVAPIVTQNNGKINFYYPITTNTMCLQCHGVPTKQIKPVVLNKIKELYPADDAVGYGINDVRGIWAITFEDVPNEK